ncbi:PREDICTED: protein AIG2 A [Tarenaya hassleriana]|uniref:protein AIG2 A n=1 Tax=Tarenaya hassleriana TaxID=28532 RepID=UPI00053C2E38|nr:PREDICTED: protein AIG2 A [Tarenaya hassleriana]
MQIQTQTPQLKQTQKEEKMSSSEAKHNLFVYGGLQEPDVVRLLLNRAPDSVSALLPGFHRFRLKGRVYPAVLPSENGKIPGKVLKGLTDDELKMLDLFEDVEYDRKTVEVVLTDTSEKMQVETYVWGNKDDPDLYGEWDFEEWKRLHMGRFLTATKNFVEGMKLPEGKTRIDTFNTFFRQDAS